MNEDEFVRQVQERAMAGLSNPFDEPVRGMSAEVTTYGGEQQPDGIRTVQHWQLRVNGEFIADTSVPRIADLYGEIAERLNEAEAFRRATQ